MLRSEYHLNLATKRFNTRYPFKPDTLEQAKKQKDELRIVREINKKLTSQETVAYRQEHNILQASIPADKQSYWELQAKLCFTPPFEFFAGFHQPPE